MGSTLANTYEYNLGDGNDVITDYTTWGASDLYDTIVFGEGITKDNIEFINGGEDDLLIQFKDHDGSIRVKKGLTNGNYRIEYYQFSDGSKLTYDEIKEMTETRGTNENDIITDTILSEKIYGYDGDDTITSSHGKDAIIGGKGDDVITAGAFSNYYEYNLGDGDDVITDKSFTTRDANADTIIFGEGITKDNIEFINGGENDLLIQFKDHDGSIRIKKGLVSGDYRIEYYQFADGTKLNYDTIKTLIETRGTDGDDVITDSELGEKIYGYDGNDTITSTEGKDYIIGGKGDDIIAGNILATAYEYNLGDGDDVITDISTNLSNSNFDTIIFGEGITRDNIEFINCGEDDLLIQFKGEEGSIRIKKGLIDSYYRIENYQFSDGSKLTYDEIKEKIETRGTNKNDIITDSGLNDIIYGYDGNDTITSTEGKDTIIGGKGDDIITGSGMSNTYIYNLGDGNDTITDYCAYSNDDTIIFGEGITKDDLIFSNGGDGDLLILFKDKEGSIRIKNALKENRNAIEYYKFSDGTTLKNQKALESIVTLGTNGDDELTDTKYDEKIYGYDGDDVITSTGGRDYIVGGKGDDIITGYILSNTYEYNLGDGNDTITDYSSNPGGNPDTIVFGEGITKDNIEFLNGGEDDLLIQFKGEEGSIRIKKGLTTDRNKIEYYQFADGSKLTYNEIKEMTETRGTNNDDVITDTILNEKIYGYDGNDTITSTEGKDTIIGGKGDDIITGSGMSNTYIYNLGDGNDTITDYCAYSNDDTIIFGEGITKDDLIFSNGGDGDLLILFKDKEGSIRIKNALKENRNAIEYYKFSDGTTLKNQKALESIVTLGTNGDDELTDTKYDEKIYGYDGDDVITSTGGRDYIVGGKGDDIITGYILSNTYEYNLGDGNDTITDYSSNPGGNPDTIVFGEGITKDNTTFRNSNGDLLITFNNHEGSIRIINGVSDNHYRIENYKFADNTSLTYNGVSSLLTENTVNATVFCVETESNINTTSTYDINTIIQDMTSYGVDDTNIIPMDTNTNNEELMNLVVNH